MFDRPAPARRAKPWRASPTLLPVSNARGFAPVRWGEDGEEPVHDFADAGFPHKPQDFHLQRYQPLSQPLSELSKQALARFDAELAAENPVILDAEQADEEPKLPYRPEPLLTHPPFVPDVWEDDEPEPVDTASEAADAEGASAQDDLQAQTTHDAEPLSEAVADEVDSVDARLDDMADSAPQALATDPTADTASVQHEPVPQEAAETENASEAENALEALASDAEAATDPAHTEGSPSQETASTDAEVLAHDAASTPVEPEAIHEASTDTPASDPSDDAALNAAEADATEAALTDEDVLEPQALEVAEQERQEAAAQATTAVPGIDAEEMARREAEHYQRGYDDGERATREALAQEVAAQRTVLEGVAQELHALLQSPQQFFEPLKRLALHVAEQVVLTELQTSTRAIEQLIQRCLDTLDHAAQGAVVVELHPQDKQRLQEAAPELIQGMRLDAVDDLRPGSVRLFANDTVVEDLVQHRLHALARSLQLDVEAWQAHSPLLNDAAASLAAPDPTEPDDVHS